MYISCWASERKYWIFQYCFTHVCSLALNELCKICWLRSNMADISCKYWHYYTSNENMFWRKRTPFVQYRRCGFVQCGVCRLVRHTCPCLGFHPGITKLFFFFYCLCWMSQSVLCLSSASIVCGYFWMNECLSVCSYFSHSSFIAKRKGEKERDTSEFVLLPADGIDSEGVRVLIARGNDCAC